MRLFGEYQREKAEYDAIVRKERQVDEKKEAQGGNGGKGKRAQRRRREKREAARRKEEEVRKDGECFEQVGDGKEKLREKLSSLEKLEMEEESEIYLLQEEGEQMNEEGMKLSLEEMELLVEMKRIDDEVAELNAKKAVAFERRQQALEESADLDEKFNSNREAVLVLAKKSQGTLKLIKLVKKKLNQTEAEEEKKVPGNDMLTILEKQIKEMEEELECPVCFEVPKAAPIYKCSDDHLICKECRPRVGECPQCREVFAGVTFKRFRGAERQAARLVGDCPGCPGCPTQLVYNWISVARLVGLVGEMQKHTQD